VDESTSVSSTTCAGYTVAATVPVSLTALSRITVFAQAGFETANSSAAVATFLPSAVVQLLDSSNAIVGTVSDQGELKVQPGDTGHIWLHLNGILNFGTSVFAAGSYTFATARCRSRAL
jgi:hypothetical protein